MHVTRPRGKKSDRAIERPCEGQRGREGERDNLACFAPLISDVLARNVSYFEAAHDPSLCSKGEPADRDRRSLFLLFLSFSFFFFLLFYRSTASAQSEKRDGNVARRGARKEARINGFCKAQVFSAFFVTRVTFATRNENAREARSSKEDGGGRVAGQKKDEMAAGTARVMLVTTVFRSDRRDPFHSTDSYETIPTE